jgi:hypothetical protein
MNEISNQVYNCLSKNYGPFQTISESLMIFSDESLEKETTGINE